MVCVNQKSGSLLVCAKHDPPDRTKHTVSEFVRKRGRIQKQFEEEESEKEPQLRKKPWRNDKSQKQRRFEQSKQKTTSAQTENCNTEPKQSRQDKEHSDETPPDYAD